MVQITLVCGNTILVDEEDAPLVHSYKWRLHVPRRGKDKPYVKAGGRYLHRCIFGASPGQLVDHRNGDTLDMRRENLRGTNPSGNAINQCKKRTNNRGGVSSSRFKGVSIDSRLIGRAKPWQVFIRTPDGVHKRLGSFSSDVEGAYAYDMASIEFHGDLGRRNFLPLVA